MGNLAVIGIVSQQTIAPTELPQEQQDAAYLLHKEALNYIKRWNQAEEELSSLLRLALIRPIPTVLTVGGVIEVDYLLDQPHEFTFKGIFMDADLRSVELVPNSSFSLQPSAFLQLSSLQGSVLENKVIEDDFGIQCISTAKLFQTINQQTPNQKPINIDKTNLATVLPTLSLPQNIKDAITNAVNQGFTVRVPQTERAYEDWTGIGYIMERASTGEAGYMLSGQIAGGMTAWSGNKWPGIYWNMISRPYSEPPDTNPNAAYSIYKISSGDRQEGKAGEVLSKPLQVMVLNRQGRPVAGAQVIFRVLAGEGSFQDNVNSIQVLSGRNGLAETSLTLGQKTAKNPVFIIKGGDTYGQQVGLNLVDAELNNGTHLQVPFTAYGFPGDPYELRKLYGDGKVENILSFNGLLSVQLVDQYQNPVANKEALFTAQRAEADSACFPAGENRVAAMLVKVGDTCMQGVASYAGCSNNGDTSQKVITSAQGAMVQIFLGAIPQAVYKITAQVNGVAPVTFTQATRDIGACKDPHAPVRMLNVSTMYQADSLGNSINAAKSGAILPLNARAYFLLEQDKITDFDLTCSDTNNNPYIKHCKRLDGIGGFQEVAPLEATVDFDGQNSQALANGLYNINYKLPDQPGDYNIRIHAKGQIKIQKDNADCQSTCKIEDEYLLEKEAWTAIPVFSVGFTIPEKIVVMVDEKGLATGDTKIDYTILPAEYRAASAFIFIYKDEVLDTYIPTETQGAGFGTISRGYEFDPNKTYAAQVALNYGTGVEINSNRIPIRFASLAVKKNDIENFPDTQLRWDDYYPQMGAKTITLLGKDDQGQLITSGRIQAEVIYPDIGNSFFKYIQLVPIENGAFNKDGQARIQLSGTTMLAPMIINDPQSGLDQIEIRFSYISEHGELKGSIKKTWNIKNNFNTTMGEVLDGLAVFVFDESNALNHVCKTPDYVTDDRRRYFDFVPELLNQVVPRKRSVTGYNLLDEQGSDRGKYNDTVAQVIGTFKDQFRVDNVGKSQGDFMKLMTDYNKTGQIADWSNRIVDKYILVGTQESPDHYLINDNTDGDTGLYELYENVVKKFVNNIIHLCESYRDNSNPNNDIQGWVSRISSGVTHTVTGFPQPVAYSYGGRRTVSEFNASVSRHGAPTYDQIQNNNAYISYQQYQANLLDAGPNVNNPLQRTHGIVGGGNKKWPGLIKDPEYNIGNGNVNSCWYWPYWAGIDCIGLTLNALRYADRPGTYAADQLLPADQPVLGTNVADVCCMGNGSWGPLHHNVTEMAGILYNTNVQNFFNPNNTNLLFQWPMDPNTGTDKLIHKGDFIRYGQTHISNVYSERWGISSKRADYDIIHAYGGNLYFDRTLNINIFSRKVMITGNDLPQQGGGILQPAGFGRIKLWD